MELKGETYRELLGPAMTITDQQEADEYLDALVRRCMERSGKDHQECEAIQKSNLGYYAGYYNKEVRERVYRLFDCSHPVFGKLEL